MIRSVLFIDPPAFVATVERIVAPALRSRPLAVAPPGADRATVLALSPEAQAAGISRGMLVRQAKKLCPDLVLLPPNPRLYARASRALHEILRIYAPVIEPRGYGHAFLDLTGTERLFGPLVDVAERIRREAGARLRLPLTVGAAVNKLVSEAATRVGRLDGWNTGRLGEDLWPMLVPGGSESPFLAPHSMQLLPGVPEDILVRLDEYQLERIGQVAEIAESELCAVFGTRGRLLRAQSRGIDARPVLPPEVKAEYRVSHTLATDTNDLGILHALLRRLTEAQGWRLRRRGLAARRMVVEVEYADCTASSRGIPLPAAALDQELWAGARRALGLAMTRRIAVRTVTVTVDRLLEARAQLDLFEATDTADDVLQRAVDRIRSVNGERSTVNGKNRAALPPSPFPLPPPGENNLPNRSVVFHGAVRRGGLPHREHAMHDGPEHRVASLGMAHAEHWRIAANVGAEERQHPLGELGDQRRALLETAGAHGGADDLEPLAENDVEVRLRNHRPLQKTEEHEPAARREQREVLLERRTAQHIENDVHGKRDLLPEGAAGGIDPEVEPQRTEGLELARRARGAEDGGAQHPGKLHRGGSDPARHRVHQHAFPPGEPAPGDQRVIGGEKGLGYRRRLGERQVRRDRQRLLLVHDHEFGVRAAADQTHDPVPGAPAGHAVTH